MKRFMLDTNIVSYAFRDRPPEVLQHLRAVRPDQICISSITLGELRFGAAHSQSQARYDAMIDAFIARVDVLAFDETAAQHYGVIRSVLERMGQGIGDLDMLIAGHAVASHCVLVTNNLREFSRVPGLHVEDWSIA